MAAPTPPPTGPDAVGHHVRQVLSGVPESFLTHLWILLKPTLIVAGVAAAVVAVVALIAASFGVSVFAMLIKAAKKPQPKQRQRRAKQR